jgi:hypothetical protein
VFTVLVGARAPAAETPRLLELRTQQVGDTTFFHARFHPPADMTPPPLQRWTTIDVRDLTRLPQLVPQDGQTRSVYQRLESDDRRANQQRESVPVEGLEFLGKTTARGKVSLLFPYPTEEEATVPDPENKDGDGKPKTKKIKKSIWAEVPVELDIAKAEKVAVPADARNRKRELPPTRLDLEGLWATAQAQRFAVLESLTPDFNFYSFAREACGRKYGVAVAPRWNRGGFAPNAPRDHQRLYETTTGAAAIAESLQLERMIGRDFRDNGKRTIDVTKIQGVDIAEHPWKKMMGDNKPSPEPLAKMAPHDNYYLHFKNLAKLIEVGELFDQLGTNIVRAYELHSKDYQLRQRYEKQLCVKSTWMGKKLGPIVVRSLAVTGSDAYLREGSDITLLFDCANKTLFLSALNQFIAEAKKEWGEALKEAKTTYHEVEIESFVTTQREVSLYRAIIGDVVIYSNSKEGLKRVIDTHQGKHKALADSLDFQYMRTVFRLEDEKEDGFAFLSDAFIRQLVGPASKIKEKRRLEALASLYMKTNEALFAAWETGQLPGEEKQLVAATVLKPEELYAPDGKTIVWDGGRKVAVSDLYNTLHFATPLVEIPIDLVTPTEEADYRTFRLQYMGLWRQYFDPIGMRFHLTDKQVRVETYILPLVATSQYNELRRRTGGGTANLDVNGYSPKTIFQYVMHLSPDAPERNDLSRGLGIIGANQKLDWLGKWFMIRFDDSPVYGELAKLQMRYELDPDAERNRDWKRETELVFQMPATIGVDIKNPLVFAGVLTALRAAVMNAAPNMVTWETLPDKYKDIPIVRIQATPKGELARWVNGEDRKEPFLPAVYYINLDGAFYASLRAEPIKDLIDRSVLRKEGKLPKPELVPINNSLYLAPAALERTKEYLSYYLEYQSHRQALGNLPIWHVLYRGGLLAPDATAETKQQMAMRFFGYVPVSPDATGYNYERKTDEVVNARHGSLRKQTQHAGVAQTSPLEHLLQEFRTIRADLRFKEDGINTVVTIERQRK